MLNTCGTDLMGYLDAVTLDVKPAETVVDSLDATEVQYTLEIRLDIGVKRFPIDRIHAVDVQRLDYAEATFVFLVEVAYTLVGKLGEVDSYRDFLAAFIPRTEVFKRTGKIVCHIRASARVSKTSSAVNSQRTICTNPIPATLSVYSNIS